MTSVSADEVLVMGAAIVHRGRLLAARRTAPPDSAGRWELPGGKVEPGEEPSAAVVREIREELSCEVRVTALLPHREPIRPGLVLRVALAELVTGEPVPHEHDAIWWLGPDELDRVRWLRPDRPFLPGLREHLRTAARARPASAAPAVPGVPA
ncbi:(deoxy)nucleoside triphosphate pyrophosphohydrolase [Nocardioides mesophilus]|uniref:8-oxo-dGTP diphosphatase n=1 Tax=Nocardioides mesophilus TaxID=433659 RepID=A0A7G9R7Y4_9ACTN|nr:(deoxy)nucleoside triphosphate pyrophosphohydrolase [Nocardioides mesophilus]QNN51709.1 (deoxy)nucleoside triphosphate pyrophosphohydrolase [Nocardioides mesophilus]